MRRVEIFDHQIEGCLPGFDFVALQQDEVGSCAKLENGKVVAARDRPHSELEHEFARFVDAIGRQADVAHPERRSRIR